MRRRSLPRWSALPMHLVLPVALLAACGDDNGSEDPTCDTPPADLCDGDRLIAYAPTGTLVGEECAYEATSTVCAAGCADARCLPAGSCDGVSCETPPAAACDGNTAVSFTSPGTCDDGNCTYVEVREDCTATAQECRLGACVSVSDPCDGVTCDEPPSASCADNGARLTWDPIGVCSDGDCAYTSTETPCEAGERCEAGACVTTGEPLCSDEIPCDNPPDATCDVDGNRVTFDPEGICNEATGVCTYIEDAQPCPTGERCDAGACVPDVADPCEGVTCDAPPGPGCSGDDRLVFSPTGVCDDGECTYASTVEPCDGDLVCVSGTCVDPTIDLCDGVTCDEPPDDDCADGETRRLWELDGTCDDGLCSYDFTTVACGVDEICVDGACIDASTDLCELVTCNAPPGPGCSGEDARLVFATPGTCTDGVCSYTSSVEPCDAGDVCRDGACITPDPCDGVVCNAPPGPACDGEDTVNYASPGTCSGGVCNYDETRATCTAPATCEISGAEARCVVDLEPGDLLFTEVMYNPGGPDAGREWFEIVNRTPFTLDLDGYVFRGNVAGDTFTVEGPLLIGPDEYLVFGNGPLAAAPIGADYIAENFVLANTRDFIELWTPGEGERLARVSWDQAPSDGGLATPVADGATLQLDGLVLDSAADDDRADWCLGSTVYDTIFVDQGTPGTANTDCLCSGVLCLDLEGRCDDTVATRITSGQCEAGVCIYTEESETCAEACSFGECTTASTRPAPGDLVINEIFANSRGTTNSGREYIELRNISTRNLNLRGLRVTDDGDDAFVIDRDITVFAGEHLLLAASPDVPGPRNTFYWGGDAFFLLNNNADQIILSIDTPTGEVELDAVRYDRAAGWDIAEGVSIGLAPGLPDPVSDNDDPANWCRQNSETSWGFDNLGTPGTENLTCEAAPDDLIGAVIFTEIMARSRSGTGDPGEYIELYNTRDVPFDLSGCTVTTGTTLRITFPADTSLAAESFVVIGNSTNPATNLGNNASFAFTGALTNTGFTFALECGGFTIDDGSIGSGPANALSIAWQLRPAFFDHIDNNTAANWCSSSTAPIYNDTVAEPFLRGTPGTMNDCGTPP